MIYFKIIHLLLVTFEVHVNFPSAVLVVLYVTSCPWSPPQVAAAAEHRGPRGRDQHGVRPLPEELPPPPGAGQGAGRPGGRGHLPRALVLPGPPEGLRPRAVGRSLCLRHGGE